MSRQFFALENAAFAAWPALETHNIDSWHLRFANGYTKRANSANAQMHIGELSVQTLTDIEAHYRTRMVTPVFRLVSFATEALVDHLLVDHGYRFCDMTLVQCRSLADQHVSDELGIELLPVTEWFAAFQRISGKVGAGQETHLKMLQSIAGECAFAVIRQNGFVVCCGLAVISERYCGLFDIATATNCRDQGLATRLCDGLLAWGKQKGADTAYLQVTVHNLAAITVYEKLGFRRAYHYWYRVGTL